MQMIGEDPLGFVHSLPRSAHHFFSGCLVRMRRRHGSVHLYSVPIRHGELYEVVFQILALLTPAHSFTRFHIPLYFHRLTPLGGKKCKEYRRRPRRATKRALEQAIRQTSLPCTLKRAQILCSSGTSR